MDITQLYDYCLSLNGTSESFPFEKFDGDVLVFKVATKMFALTSLKDWEKENYWVNLKCDPDYALELRAQYEAVQPGFHMNKKHWNSVYFHQDLSDKEILKLIKHSYDLVVKSLPKKAQDELQ